MSQFVFKMPDLGEGTVEAEIVAWHTQPGAVVTEDQVIVEVMTDKAAVEVPAPVSGRVLSITGSPGRQGRRGFAPDRVRDGVGGAGAASTRCGSRPAPRHLRRSRRRRPWRTQRRLGRRGAPSAAGRAGRVMTSPANRRRAREAGIDLSSVAGSGPGGRILRSDLGSTGAGATASQAAGVALDAGARPRKSRSSAYAG